MGVRKKGSWGHRKTRTGVVVSDGMEKTIVVQVSILERLLRGSLPPELQTRWYMLSLSRPLGGLGTARDLVQLHSKTMPLY